MRLVSLAGISMAGTTAEVPAGVAAGAGVSVATTGASGTTDWAIDMEAAPNKTAPKTDEKNTRIHHS
jgi:hypothetical protein